MTTQNKHSEDQSMISEKERAKLAWIEMNKKRLDEIEAAKRRDFRFLIILQLVNMVLILVTLIKYYYA